MVVTFGLKEYGRNTRWSYKRGGRKAGFHCTQLHVAAESERNLFRRHRIGKKREIFNREIK